MIKLYLPILIPLYELENFNQSLVKRGELLPDIKLEKMNKNKEASLCIDLFI